MKKCTRCLIEKSVNEFHKTKHDKRFSHCKACRSAAAKVYRDKNPEYNKIYKSNNLEKVKNSYRNWVTNMHNSIFSLLGEKCAECGENIREFLAVDHIFNNRNQEQPIHSYKLKLEILKGKRCLSQYQILCHNCNESKPRIDPIHKQKRTLIGKMKLCNLCLMHQDESEFYDIDRARCRNCVRYKDIIKYVECCIFMGGKCVCCGITDYSKLNFDHINNDGGKRRKEKNEKVGIDIARKILKNQIDVKDFQLLCSNCNHSKHFNKGRCIHDLNNLM